jgi:hypothetical protein
MASSSFHKSKRFRIVCLLLGCVAICAGYLWLRPVPAEKFRIAMERHDFDQAEKLWNKGVRVPATDPYAQFMRIKQRLQAVNGVQVTAWKVGRLQTINETNRYFGLLDLQDSGGDQLGIGLEWQGVKWVLKTDNPQVPPYVRQSLDGGG